MALIFNSITQFEIQPERTKHRVKRDDLDTLSEVWTGPSDSEDTFVPAIGSAHPDYGLMTVIDTSVKRMPANVSEVTINYQGKFDGSGSGSYYSLPTISQSWMEGEVSYQTVVTNNIRVPTGAGGYFSFPQIGVSTYSRRYTGRACTIAYITNQRPTGNPSQLGLAYNFLGFTNVWEVLSSFQPGESFNIQGTPITQMVCTDVKIEDRADGWYRVTETYQSRQFPGAAIKGPTFGQIGVSTRVVDVSAPQPPPVQGVGANNLVSATGAAEGAAAYQKSFQLWTGALQSSGGGTIQQDTAHKTGIDPAWGTGGDYGSGSGSSYVQPGSPNAVYQAAQAAASSTDTFADAPPETGMVSTPLEY
jgi:hypothetical protein